METKPWYKSKTVWVCALGILFGVYDTFRVNLATAAGHPMWPEIPPIVLSILAGFGLYGRVSATTKIG